MEAGGGPGSLEQHDMLNHARRLLTMPRDRVVALFLGATQMPDASHVC